MLDFSELVMGAVKVCSERQALLQGLEGCATELAAGPVFVVSEVMNASGGRTGCFLYKGRLVSAAPRAATPDHRCPALHGGAGELAGEQEVPQLSLCGDEQQDLMQYEGQQLTLYFSYEEASPKVKQRLSAARAAAAAPWRAIMRDENDEMIFSMRGLPEQVLLDEELQLAAWGPDLTVAFPTAKDAATFAAGLVRVAVQPCSLANSPAAAAAVQAAAEAALCRAVAATKAPGSCPPSPTLAEQPLASGKRKAEAAGLQTPVVRPLKLAIITPTCSGDLAALLN